VALIGILCLLLSGCLQALGQQGDLPTAAPTESAVINSTPDQTGEASPTAPTSTLEGLTATDTPEPGMPSETVAAQTSVPPSATAPTAPTTIPLPTVPVGGPPLSNQQIWRAQEQNRAVFNPPKQYHAPGQILLLWFDPRTRQIVPLGWVDGQVDAQAKFKLQGSWVEALEVSYVPNKSFGLILSNALIDRIKGAGYKIDDQTPIETFVYLAHDMSAQS